MNEEYPKPSEWAEIRRKNREKTDRETEKLLKEQRLADAMPEIESIMRWVDDPPELKVYLDLFPKNPKLSEAISVMFLEEPYKSILEKKERDCVGVLHKYRLEVLKDFALQYEEKEEREGISKEQVRDAGSGKYPVSYKKRIITAAVLLFERQDNVSALNIYTELRVSKSTYYAHLKHFGLNTTLVRDTAQRIIREKEK